MANTNVVHNFSKSVATNVTNQARCFKSNIAEQLSYGTPVSTRDNVHDWVVILLNSWRLGTKLNYQCSLKRWFLYSQKHNITDIQYPTMQQALGFLTTLHEDGCSYNQICTARSALSALITCYKNYTWGKLPIVQWFMKVMFQTSPKLPNYFCTWDVKIVFNYFRSLEMPNKLSLKSVMPIKSDALNNRDSYVVFYIQS